ncbi:MAG: hypothetical protein ACLQVY_02115 [Limisphaerales bacterium]
MKKTLAVLTLLAGAVSGYSQGQVNMSDYFNSDYQITIWSPQAADATVALTGNSPSTFGPGAVNGGDIPSGTQTGYTGTPLGGSATGAVSPTDFANGNLWSVALYAAPYSGTLATAPLPATDLVPGSTANMMTVPGNIGLYNSTASPSIPGVPGGSAAQLEIKAWYNGQGAYPTFEAAAAASPVVPTGYSTIGAETLVALPGTPNDLPAPGESQTLAGGITSFSLTGAGGSVTPEPSTIALGIMGASAFLMRLRRKQ